jgi:hypothetical protein
MDFQASVARVERELVRLGEHGLDTQTWCRAADGVLDRVVGFDGSCWHTIDPATVLITSHLTLNLPSRFPLLAANEYLAEDVNKFADLAAAPHPVGVLSQATDGQPQRSQRWQEMLRPNGFDAEQHERQQRQRCRDVDRRATVRHRRRMYPQATQQQSRPSSWVGGRLHRRTHRRRAAGDHAAGRFRC